MAAPWSRYRFKKSVLTNGVRVVTENHPNAVAASVGFFIDKGTRDEQPDEAGLAHFVEHMVFKSTAHRTAFQISKDMEEVGADINAYTSRETTSYVAFGLSEHLERYVDVLSDVVTRPKFARRDVDMERDVVIQEIRSSEDMLEDCVFDRHFEEAFRGTSLALPILGSIKSIESISRERVLKFYRRAYLDRNLVVAAAGRVDHDELCGYLEKYLSPMKSARAQSGKASSRARQETAPETATELALPQARGFSKVIKRRAEQAHILIGAPSPGFRDDRRFEAMVLNGILGGGLTSRLYQQIRENRGLAYAVYSQLYSFVDAGTMLMYAATEPTKAPDALSVALKEMAKLRQKGFSKEEMTMVQTQVRASTIIGSDDPESRMQSLGINELVFGRYRPIGEVLEEFERVKPEAVQDLAETALRPEVLGITLMGPLPEKPMREWIEKSLKRKRG
ncbi:MAG: pitrilysin family protein [Bdellovibrionales bacterium]|nr:pitrilysin family protein [Bdellovibrionales bacterium]